MAIKKANGTIVINHTVSPVTLAPLSRDDGKGIEVFEYPDSTLQSAHVLQKRDLGRTLSSDGLVVHKGKVTVISESVTATGRRRTNSMSLSLSANSDFTSQVLEQQIRDLGQFALDHAADLAAGRFSS